MKITENVGKAFYKTKFAVKKHSPEILMIGGAIGVVSSAIMACRATTKLSKVMDTINIRMANEDEVSKLNTVPGFIGPIGLDLPIIIDNEVSTMVNFVVGANKKDYHYKNVNIDDFEVSIVADI